MLDNNMEWKKYIRTNQAEMRPYIKDEELDKKVSISAADKNGGSPMVGDMIARNPKDHDDQWLVAKKYFKENFKELDSKKKDKIMENILKGGLGDKMSLEDIAKKHNVSLQVIQQQLAKGIKVEMEHTTDKKVAREIAIDHLVEDAYYYDKLKKIESKEQTMSGASGSFEAPMGTGTVKRPISKIHNSEPTEESKKGEFKEATTSAVSAGAQYDVPLGGSGRHTKTKIKTQKDALRIDNPDDIKASKIGKKKSSPYDYGVDIKEKCKTFPYCNQGDINALNITHITEAINVVSKKYGIPQKDVEKIVLKEIRDIFM